MALFPVKLYLPGALVQYLVEAGKEGDGRNGRCQNITDRLGPEKTPKHLLATKVGQDEDNTKLIYRTTRNMSLTEEGQHLYEVLVSALGQIDDALKDVGDTQLEPTGLLRIKFLPVLQQGCLLSLILASFLLVTPKQR